MGLALSAPLTIGLLRLTDAAPVIMAHERGIFAAHGLDVRLSVEPSWANIADKLIWGRLQAAVMPPPLALATALGLRGQARRLIVPMTVSLGGNSVTFSAALAARMEMGPGALAIGAGALAIGGRLRELIAGGMEPPRFAVVHTYSTHNLLLRYWLSACGIGPGELSFEAIPPAQVVAALAAGRVDGFCAGAPWGQVAEAEGVGRSLLPSAAIWPRHPEKCLAVAEDWAEAQPAAQERLIDALLAAAVYCDDPGNAPEIAAVLADDRYLGLEAAIIRASLPGGDPCISFHAYGANLPRAAHARWMLDQMARWSYLPAGVDRGAAVGLYRPAVYRRAVGRAGVLEVMDGGGMFCAMVGEFFEFWRGRWFEF